MKSTVYPLSLLTLAALLCFSSISFGESFGGGRSNGHLSYYLDESALQYGYGPHLNHAANAWNNISPSVTLSTSQSSKGADVYMVGNSAIDGLLGVHVPYVTGFLGKPKVASVFDTWQYSALVLYHNNMQAKGLTYQQRISNAIHEIGHSLGLAHPSQGVPSVMKQGISDLMPTSYDRFELINKWGLTARTLSARRSEIRLQANYESFDTVPDADQGADLVLLASPISDFDQRKHITKYFTDGKLMDFYTITPLKIERIIKTDKNIAIKPRDLLQVLEPASYLKDSDGQHLLTYESYQPMAKEQRYLVFLKRNSKGAYSVMNMALGTIDTAGPMLMMKAAGSTENAPVDGGADASKSVSLSFEEQFTQEALSYYNIK